MPYQRYISVTVRFVIIIFSVLLIAGLSAIGYNNHDVEMPSNKELSDSLEASTVWLVENKESILDVNNYMLWYFLSRSAQVSKDQRIQSLVDLFYSKYVEPEAFNPNKSQYLWAGIFKPGTKIKTPPFEHINSMIYYVQHFFYAVNCDEELGQLDSIRAQNEPDFCGSAYLLNPTCTTHQLMGIRFLQRANCGDQAQLSSTVNAIQAKIVNELTFDPRVVDVYIQRAMMLVESGNPGAVNNIWIRRILDHQQSDGGWGNFQPLISLAGDKDLHLGFGHGSSETGNPRAGDTFLRVFGIGQVKSTFHATAQGILLLTLLNAQTQ